MIGNMWLITSCWSMWRLFYCQRSNNKSFPKDCPWVSWVVGFLGVPPVVVKITDCLWWMTLGAFQSAWPWPSSSSIPGWPSALSPPSLTSSPPPCLRCSASGGACPRENPSLSWTQLKHLLSKLLKPPMYTPPLKITLNPTQPPLHPPKPTVPTQAPHYQGETFPAATVLLRHQLHQVRFPK